MAALPLSLHESAMEDVSDDVSEARSPPDTIAGGSPRVPGWHA